MAYQRFRARAPFTPKPGRLRVHVREKTNRLHAALDGAFRLIAQWMSNKAISSPATSRFAEPSNCMSPPAKPGGCQKPYEHPQQHAFAR